MPTYHINRSRNLIQILQGRGWQEAAPGETADFGMWCPYRVAPRSAHFQLFDGRVTQLLDDKLSMDKLLTEFEEQEITPAVFSALPDYLNYLKSTNSRVFCFLKTTHGAGGAGVFFFNNLKALLEKLIEIKNFNGTIIIQQGIRDAALIKNRKFKIRTYVLVTRDWQTYVYNDSMAVLHKAHYSPDSENRDVQISPGDGDTAILLNYVSALAGVDLQIQDIVSRLINCLKRKVLPLANFGDYHLFGLDFICDAQNKAFLIEVNGFPNLERKDTLSKSLSKRMMQDLITLVIDPAVTKTNPITGGFSKVS